MTPLRIGQLVRVIDGPRKGEVTTITGGPIPVCRLRSCPGNCTHLTEAVDGYELDLPSKYPPHDRIAAPAHWLLPLDDRDPCGLTLAELIEKEVRSVGAGKVGA